MARFATVAETDLKLLLEDKSSQNTKKATSVMWRVLHSYMKEKKIEFSVETCLKTELNAILRNFYAEVRKKDGTFYSKQSFMCMRSALHRMIKGERSDIDIIEDREFLTSNEVFLAQCVYLKKNGLGKITHKEPISPADMKKLYQSSTFDCKSPISLQRKVFFDIMLFLCRRGNENLRELKKDSFQVSVDDEGREYLEKYTDEMTKNRRENNEAVEGGRIYATDFTDCPVMSYKQYMTVLNPKIDAFFQRPKSARPLQGPWFDAMPVGFNQLGKMMKRISIEAGLSMVYTNHCLRATSVTILDNCGIEARHIMSVSGHRSEKSIRSYSRTGAGMKRKMFNELSNYCHQSNSRDVVLPTKRQDDVPTKKPRPFISAAKVNNMCAETGSTFEFGVADFGNDEENDTEDDQVVASSSQPVSSTYCHKKENRINAFNKLKCFVGDTKHVEFNNCVFNIK